MAGPRYARPLLLALTALGVEMDFARIQILDGEIDLDKWREAIVEMECLEQAPDRKGVNPFTNEEVVFRGEGTAFYSEGGEQIGSITLESGALLTTSVPHSFYIELAQWLGASVSEDDRS